MRERKREKNEVTLDKAVVNREKARGEEERR